MYNVTDRRLTSFSFPRWQMLLSRQSRELRKLLQKLLRRQ